MSKQCPGDLGGEKKPGENQEYPRIITKPNIPDSHPARSTEASSGLEHCFAPGAQLSRVRASLYANSNLELSLQLAVGQFVTHSGQERISCFRSTPELFWHGVNASESSAFVGEGMMPWLFVGILWVVTRSELRSRLRHAQR